MKLTEDIIFPPFRLDSVNEQLWREDQLIPLRPKTFAVLRFLVEHAGRLVTKDELLKGVWPETRVSEGILKGYIRDLRDILGDDSQQPRFIETVPRRGHRFIGHVVSSQHSVASSPPLPTQASVLSPQHAVLVGRDTELAYLHSLFEKALSGERQIVFVTGEPGIGKTTLVEEFLFGVQNSEPRALNTELPSTPDPWIGRGQCVEQHGAGEAYLPVLEALGRIGRSPDGEQLVTILRQYAPTWLVQMPALLTAEELATLQRRVVGATRERMLREMVEAIEVLTAHRPLVLWLEDLHWADASTVDWLAAVAHQAASARLLVIGTYRPSDLSLRGHPLRAVKQELVAKGQCEELWLSFLSAEDVTHYLTRRYIQHQFPLELGTAIHRRTDGNPLFVVNMLDYLAAQRVIVEMDGHWHLQAPVEEVVRGVPDSLRQLIEKQVERLSEEQQRLLEVASVVGVTFSAAAVATGIEAPVEQVEEWCDNLVKRGQFLQAQELRVLPDGTICGSYGFLHALQHAVLYDRIPSLRRLRLHRRVGDGEEQSYGTRAHEIANELAVHFERGQEYDKAAQYHHQAGLVALRRQANREAIAHFTHGIVLLTQIPETPDRWRQELQLQAALIGPIIMMNGYSAPALEHACARARLLCQQLPTPLGLFPILYGLFGFYMISGQLHSAREISNQLMQMSEAAPEPVSLLIAQGATGGYHMYSGAFGKAQQHLIRSLALYDLQQHRHLAYQVGDDPGVMYRCFLAWTLWFLGYPDQAMATLREAQKLAQELDIPSLTGGVLYTGMLFFHLSRQPDKVQEYSGQTIRLEDENGRFYWGAAIQIFQGWALSCTGQGSEGIARAAQGIQQLQAIGFNLWHSYKLAVLVEAYMNAGRLGNAYRTVNEALAAAGQFGSHWYDAELYRLKGMLTLQSQASLGQVAGESAESQRAKSKRQKSEKRDPQSLILDSQGEAEACFLKAIAIGRQQQAKSLELRAVMSLVRLRKEQAQHATHSMQHAARNLLTEAHQMLAEIYNWFTEGFDTKDLQEAKALLESLSP